MSKASERAELRAKINTMIETLGRPMTSNELAIHPLLISEKMSPKSVAANLRVMPNIKQFKNGTWGISKKRATDNLPDEVLPHMYFVLNITNKSVILDVGGMRLPVRVEF
jgi:hypothetical protein